MDWLDYREKLKIGFNDKQKVELFYVKLFNVLNQIIPEMNSQYTEGECFKFCNMTGTPMDRSYRNNYYEYVLKVLSRHKENVIDFVAYYIAFVNCRMDAKYKEWTQENLRNLFLNCLDQSHMPFELYEDKDGCFVFPKGVKEMDEALVSQPLTWLAKYPDSERAWKKALRKYAESSATDASDVADLFRKALETFFQEFFSNSKSLENNKAEYGNYLKSKGVPKEISSNLETLLQLYTNYMNNYAKHHDATSEKVLEYLMYQTGNIIRLLITL